MALYDAKRQIAAVEDRPLLNVRLQVTQNLAGRIDSLTQAACIQAEIVECLAERDACHVRVLQEARHRKYRKPLDFPGKATDSESPPLH